MRRRAVAAVAAEPRNPAQALLWRLSPSDWARDVLDLDLADWQQDIADRRGELTVLIHRQAGKTFTAAIIAAHEIVQRRSTSVVLAPTQRQSAELIRRTRENVLKAGSTITVDNAFSLEIEGGGRVVGLPGTDDASIRGYSVDGAVIIDEAARVSDELYRAARPLRARFPRSRLVLLSTSWMTAGFFWEIAEGPLMGSMPVVRLRPDDTGVLAPDFLAAERRSLGSEAYAREYELTFSRQSGTPLFDLNTIDSLFSQEPGYADPFGSASDHVVHARRLVDTSWLGGCD
ncbi:terminase large subunit domain-containing protein [Geminicoccus harenae]|uniref:terminase large subunit domain-containing protein n=1 Tax=Geminicoccus harenae TaxID=2498453 RepID=UPI00168B8F9E|nr:terminase family protein [Geminicoccus harenae]